MTVTQDTAPLEYAERMAGLREQCAQRAAATGQLMKVNSELGMTHAAGAAAASRDEDKAAAIAAETIRYTERVLSRHVAWPSQAAQDAVVLWLFHANARDRDDTGMGPLIWRASPRLLLTSKVRGSGKSTGLDLLAILTASRFGRLPRITAPAFACLMGKFGEPAIIDEAKMVFGTGTKSQDLQGMILAGYTPRTCSLTAHQGGTGESLFGVVAMAGKDNLITAAGDSVSDMLDRAIIIRMERPNRHYPDIDEVAEQAGALAQQGMVTWTSMMRRRLVQAVRDLARRDCEAGELSAEDVEAGVLRSAQIWRPLLAIADTLGGDWPQRARAACEELSTASAPSETDEWLGRLHSLDGALFGSQPAPGVLPGLDDDVDEED